MPNTLHHERAQVPVTALTLAGQYLLAADGPFLRIFDREGKHNHGSLKVFKTQAVHGLVICSSSTASKLLILAYGGTFLRLISLDSTVNGDLEDCSTTLGPIACGPDWILDIVPPSLTDDKSTERFWTVAVTAHNGLLKIENASAETGIQGSAVDCLSLSVRELTTSSRCILYSAHLSWLSRSKVLVASGTAFGEILVWSCTTAKDSSPRSHIHHFFTGHEGSIFGVQISPIFFLNDCGIPRRILASCSDDRTIRLWDISDLPDHHDLSGGLDALGLIQDRETGFGANVESDASKSLAVAWGHASRVWSVRFAAEEAEEDGLLPKVPQLVSFGEDATCRLWQIDHSPSDGYSGEDKMGLTLDLIGTAALHSGKNIWSMAIARQPGNRLRVITGAADSAIVSHVWPRNCLEYVSPQPSQDAHRCCAFFSEQAFVSVTNSGQVLLGDFTCGQIDWEPIAQLDDLRGYSTSASIPELGLVLFAGNSGNIYSWGQKGTDPQVVARVDRKVAGLFVTKLISSDDVRIGLTVTKMGSDVAEFYILVRKGPSLEHDSQFNLNLPPSFIVTSALPVVRYQSPTLSVFLGSREGSIAIFHARNLPSIQDTASTLEPASIHRVHTPEAVTSLLCHPVDPYLITTGRDGRMATLSLSLAHPADHEYASQRPSRSPTPPTHLVHALSLPFGPNVEGLYLGDGKMIAYGFRGKQFVLYDTSTEEEILAVECGGSHRIWAFRPALDGSGGTFVWNQAATLKLFSATQVSHRVVRRGGHGREIKAVAVDRESKLVATGAEDTMIRLFRLHEAHEMRNGHVEMAGFRCERVLRKHVTGIQQLSFEKDFLFSCGGCEEFFVWRVREVPFVGTGVVCEAVCPTESELADLRIMGFAAKQTSVWSGDEAEFMISMVYSDSTLRTYRYTAFSPSKPEQKPSFSLIETGTYLTSCLTQCVYIKPRHLLTASTDGHMALWPVTTIDSCHASSAKARTKAQGPPQHLSHAKRSKVHQSSIKALSGSRLSDRLELVVTGGDDNALGVSLLGTDDMFDTPRVASLVMARAHAAAVTASALHPIGVYSASDEGERGVPRRHRVLAVTASNDQRVRVWEIVVDEAKEGVEGVEVRKVGEGPTCVADVSGMATLVMGGRDVGVWLAVVVVGVGMEVLRVEVEVGL